jgi:hypothetical protein
MNIKNLQAYLDRLKLHKYLNGIAVVRITNAYVDQTN